MKKVRNGYCQSGVASWYGPGFHGKKTASGEVYDMHGLTAAHSTLPLHTMVQVTNLHNKKGVIVRVNDRGPFIGERVLDLSLAAAQRLDMVKPGTVPVRMTVIGRSTTHLASKSRSSAVKKTAAARSKSRPSPVTTAVAAGPNPFFRSKVKGLLARLLN